MNKIIRTLFTREIFSNISIARPLGRWCHVEYNKNCNIEIKADLANSDNSFVSSFSGEPTLKTYKKNKHRITKENEKMLGILSQL
jgi:hypothetical protein